MDTLLTTLNNLTKEFDSLTHKKKIKFNLISFKLEHLDVFEDQLTEILNENKSKSSITDSVNQLITFLDNNGDEETLRGEKEKFYIKCLVIKTTLQELNNRLLFDIDLSQSIDFVTFLNDLLSQFESFPKTVLELLYLVIKFDCNILTYPKLEDIFCKSIPICSEPDESIIICKTQVLSSLFNLCAANRNLFRFHECFIIATNNIDYQDLSLSKDFIRLYSEKIFELNWANVHKIWKLFVENFQYCKHGLIQLFGLFLCHIKMLDSKMIELNRATMEQLATETAILIRDFTLKNELVLSIYHSLACLQFILKTYENSFDAPMEMASDLYDLTDLFTATNTNQWQEFYDNLDSLQDDQQLLFVKLMIVKYKFVRLAHLSYNNEDHKDSNSQLMMQVISKIVCNKNLIRFDILHFIVTESNQQCLTLLMEYLFENLYADDSDQLNSQIRQVFSFSSAWENANFQSVFITSFIKQVQLSLNNNKRKSSEDTPKRVSTILHDLSSKEKLWVKYGNIMPDSKDAKHQKILSLVKSACDSFVSDEYGREVEVANIRSLLNLLALVSECVPLEHLYPLNQLRCIMTLSSLLVSLKTKPKDKTKLVNLFVGINLRIWDSIRSIWLFDFMPPGEYIYQMLFHLQSGLDTRCYTLFNCYISSLFKLFDCALSNRNVYELIEVLKQNVHQVKVEYIFMVQTMILRNNAQFAKKLENKPRFAAHVDDFSQISKHISSLIFKNIKLYLDGSDTFDRLDSEFVVEGLTKLFEYKVFSSLAQTEELTLKNKWKKLLLQFISISLDNLNSCSVKKSFVNFLQVVVQNRDKLNFVLSENFVLDLWNKVAQFDFDSSPDYSLSKKLVSSSHWKKVYQKPKVYKKFVQLHLESTERSKQNTGEQLVWYNTLLDTICPLLSPIAESSTVQEFVQIIQSCNEALSQASSIARSAYFLGLYRKILQANIGLEKCHVLSENFSSILIGLINLTFLCNKPAFRNDNQVQIDIRLGALELAQVMLSHLTGHDLLTNSHIFLVYNLCTESSMVHYASNLSLFGDMFIQMNRILFDLIMRRPHLAIFSMCTQLNILTMMLVSLLKASDEKNFLNATDQEKINVENCSKSFAQTLTQLSNMDDFKSYALHLIVLYLQHSPNYSVVYFVKKNLTVGIFNLIDLVKDKEVIERLYSRLSQGSREILRVMLEHYDKYHRFKGYV